MNRKVKLLSQSIVIVLVSLLVSTSIIFSALAQNSSGNTSVTTIDNQNSTSIQQSTTTNALTSTSGNSNTTQSTSLVVDNMNSGVRSGDTTVDVEYYSFDSTTLITEIDEVIGNAPSIDTTAISWPTGTVFLYWVDDAGVQVNTITADTEELYAYVKHTVTFDTNNTASYTQEVEHGENAIKPTVDPVSFDTAKPKFDWWSTKDITQATRDEYNFTTPVVQSFSLYPVFSSDEVELTITNSEGGSSLSKAKYYDATPLSVSDSDFIVKYGSQTRDDATIKYCLDANCATEVALSDVQFTDADSKTYYAVASLPSGETSNVIPIYLNVDKFRVLITVSNVNKEFDESNPNFTYSFGVFNGVLPPNGQGFDVTISRTNSSEAVQEYKGDLVPTVTAKSGTNINNYDIEITNGNFTINKGNFEIVAKDTSNLEGDVFVASKTYDGEALTFDAADLKVMRNSTEITGITYRYYNDAACEDEIAVSDLTITNAGSKVFYVVAQKDNFNDSTPLEVELHVEKVKIKVSAQPVENEYGVTMPSFGHSVVYTPTDFSFPTNEGFTYTVSRAGSVNQVGTLINELVPSATANSFTNVGNYEIEYEPANLTITEGIFEVAAVNSSDVVEGILLQASEYDGVAHSFDQSKIKVMQDSNEISGVTYKYYEDEACTKELISSNLTIADAGSKTFYVVATKTNYRDSVPFEVDLKVEVLPITINVGNASREYGIADDLSSVEYSFSENQPIASDDIQVTVRRLNQGEQSGKLDTAQKYDGSLEAVVTSSDVSNLNNYNFSVNNGNYEITNANLIVETFNGESDGNDSVLSDSEKLVSHVYDGSSFSLNANQVSLLSNNQAVSGVTIDYYSDASYTTKINEVSAINVSDSKTVYVEISKQNYNALRTSFRLEVKPKPIQVSLGNLKTSLNTAIDDTTIQSIGSQAMSGVTLVLSSDLGTVKTNVDTSIYSSSGSHIDALSLTFTLADGTTITPPHNVATAINSNYLVTVLYGDVEVVAPVISTTQPAITPTEAESVTTQSSSSSSTTTTTTSTSEESSSSELSTGAVNETQTSPSGFVGQGNTTTTMRTTFISKGDDFIVKLDGVELDETQYTFTEEGRVVLTDSFLAELPDGVYLLRVIEGDTIQSEVIITEGTPFYGEWIPIIFWSLFNLIMVVFSIMLACLFAIREQRKDVDAEFKYSRHVYITVAILTVANVVLFLWTQDLTKEMTFFDNYSIMFTIIVLLSMASILFIPKLDDEYDLVTYE